MTEPVIPGADATPPAQTPPPTASDTQLASARAAWVRAGHDPAVFDAKMAGTPTSPNPLRDATGKFAPQQSTDLSRRPVTSDPAYLDGKQSLALARQLEKAGMNPERIRAAMAADGVTPPTETLSPQETAHNAAWHLDAAHMPEPAAYKPNFADALGNYVREYAPAELSAVRAEAGEWASKLGLPVALGTSLIERAFKVADGLERMTPAAREQWQAEQRSQLLKHVGANPVTKALAILANAPGAFNDRLAKSGALQDAFIIRSLSNWAGHISRWNAAKGKA
jgi:hypothetical protein